MKFGHREIIVLLVTLSLAAIVYAAPAPSPSDTQLGFTTFRNTSAGTLESVTAQGGNVTRINLSSKVQSTNWATFWGQVRGQWLLEATSYTQNVTNYPIYNWTDLSDSLTGYIFFSNQSDVNWANLQAAVAAGANAEDRIMGLTGPDNVSKTYIQGEEHPQLDIGGTLIGPDANAVNTSSQGGDNWQGVLIESDAGASGRIYTALIDEDKENYAGVTADYQIIVPVDSTTKTRTYFVFASLE